MTRKHLSFRPQLEVLEARDIDHALTDMLGASGRLGARILGVEPAIGFADHD